MMYMINEIAKLLNVSTNTVRRYERFGHIKSLRNDSNGYRYYCVGDVSRLMSVRALRKYGFAHNDIKKMMNYNIEELIDTYQMKLKSMDEAIHYAESLRHRLSDDVVLLEKVKYKKESIYIRECIPYSYVLYQNGENLLMEEERIKKIHEFLYLAPKVQMIYLIRQEDILSGNMIINKGWAVKSYDLEKFHIEENEFIHHYPSRHTLMSLEKLPSLNKNGANLNRMDIEKLLLEEPLHYMKEHNITLEGDVLGIKITSIREDNEEMEYILFNIPIRETN